MPRHEPSGKPDPGELLSGKVKMRRDEHGKLQVVMPDAPKVATTEAKPRPPQADDPRPGPIRDAGAGAGGAI